MLILTQNVIHVGTCSVILVGVNREQVQFEMSIKTNRLLSHTQEMSKRRCLVHSEQTGLSSSVFSAAWMFLSRMLSCTGQKFSWLNHTQLLLLLVFPGNWTTLHMSKCFILIKDLIRSLYMVSMYGVKFKSLNQIDLNLAEELFAQVNIVYTDKFLCLSSL